MVIFDSKPEKGELNKVIDHLNLISWANHYGWLIKKSHFFSTNIIARHYNSLNMHGRISNPKTILHYLTIMYHPKIYPKRALIAHYLIVMLPLKCTKQRAALISHYLTIIHHPKYTLKGPLFHTIWLLCFI